MELKNGVVKIWMPTLEIRGTGVIPGTAEPMDHGLLLLKGPDVFWFSQMEGRLQRFAVKDSKLEVHVGTAK